MSKIFINETPYQVASKEVRVQTSPKVCWFLWFVQNFDFIICILIRVNYIVGPCGLFKIWIESLFQNNYIDRPHGLYFVLSWVPSA